MGPLVGADGAARTVVAQATQADRRLGVAAAIVIAIAGGALYARRALQVRMIRVVDEKVTGGAATIAGQRTLVPLPDSSVAILGPASTLRYAFNRGARDVVLDGMAEFRVVHDTSRRFTVRAGKAVVTDIGTEFVVRAYEIDSSVRVSVASGMVSLASATSADGGEGESFYARMRSANSTRTDGPRSSPQPTRRETPRGSADASCSTTNRLGAWQSS